MIRTVLLAILALSLSSFSYGEEIDELINELYVLEVVIVDSSTGEITTISLTCPHLNEINATFKDRLARLNKRMEECPTSGSNSHCFALMSMAEGIIAKNGEFNKVRTKMCPSI